MGDMILVKSRQEVLEAISYTCGIDENGHVEQYTIGDDGRAYTNDEIEVVATAEEVERAVDEFMHNYKCGLANTWKYGVKHKPKYEWLER